MQLQVTSSCKKQCRSGKTYENFQIDESSAEGPSYCLNDLCLGDLASRGTSEEPKEIECRKAEAAVKYILKNGYDGLALIYWN